MGLISSKYIPYVLVVKELILVTIVSLNNIQFAFYEPGEEI